MTQQSPFEDIDPIETQEWLESIDSVLRAQGPQRAHFILEKLVDFTRRSGTYLPFKPNTAYLNSISKNQEPDYPGDRALERRIEAYIRWNAMAMVVQANRVSSEYGGHIASYASAATLYEVGFNHFWRARNEAHRGDMVFMQGHSSPGIYARAYLEGRLSEDQLKRFRQEVGGGGLSSYPHPWLMPEFWQFPTVSMGLGPMTAIFQARFIRYLEHRGMVPTSDRKVWAFLGDGEMDEPESMGALTMPVRAKDQAEGEPIGVIGALLSVERVGAAVLPIAREAGEILIEVLLQIDNATVAKGLNELTGLRVECLQPVPGRDVDDAFFASIGPVGHATSGTDAWCEFGTKAFIFLMHPEQDA